MAEIVDITGDDRLWEESMSLNFAEWGGKLTLDQYLSRNRQTHEILIRAGMMLHHFALFLDGKICASCQVLSRPLYVGAGRLAEDHCVAFVFVAKEHRRKGYAKMLVDHAVHLFSNDDDQVSLWSDVGAYYERSGFRFAVPIDPDVPPHATIVCQEKSQEKVDCEWLGLADMGTIAMEHCRLLNRAVDAKRVEARGSAQFGAVEPSEALYKQLQLQPVLEQQMMKGFVPEKFGARTRNGHGWAAWTYLFGFNKVPILGISGSADEVATLLAAATEAASQFGKMQVELYESQLADKDLDLDEVAAALTARNMKYNLIQRKKTLPMSVGKMIYAFPGGYGFF